MDWALVISRNRDCLLRIVAALMVLAGIGEGEGPKTLPRHRVNAIRRILRAAESAARRLVVIAARDLAAIGFPEGVFMTGLDPDPSRRPQRAGAGPAGDAPVPAFALADPPKRFSFEARTRRPASFPRITFIGASEPSPIPAGWSCGPDDDLAAGPLGRRLISLKRALDDLDGEARRLAKWQARRDRELASASGAKLEGATHKPRSPLRTGRPPGHRARQRHEVDAVLADLHSLALHALAPPDTS